MATLLCRRLSAADLDSFVTLLAGVSVVRRSSYCFIGELTRQNQLAEDAL